MVSVNLPIQANVKEKNREKHKNENKNKKRNKKERFEWFEKKHNGDIKRE